MLTTTQKKKQSKWKLYLVVLSIAFIWCVIFPPIKSLPPAILSHHMKYGNDFFSSENETLDEANATSLELKIPTRQLFKNGSKVHLHCRLFLPSTPLLEDSKHVTAKPPVVILIPPLAETHEQKFQNVAIEFAKLGIATVTFHFRGWGKSEGIYRQSLIPSEHIQDIQDIVDFIIDSHGFLNRVDPKRVALWGSEWTAGFGLDWLSQIGNSESSRYANVRGYIATLPILEGKSIWNHMIQFLSFRQTFKLTALILADLIREWLNISINPIYVPMLRHHDTEEPAFFTIKKDEPHQSNSFIMPDLLINAVSARSAYYLSHYRAIDSLHNVHTPTLLIGAVRPFSPMESIFEASSIINKNSRGIKPLANVTVHGSSAHPSYSTLPENTLFANIVSYLQEIFE